MKQTLVRGLFNLLRSPAGRRMFRWLTAWGFIYMSFAIPVKRLRETPTVMAFLHPQPAYPLHILLVPKRPVASFITLDSSASDLLTELVQIAQSLIVEFHLEQHGYRLIVNGGPHQDFPHLHIHLISEDYPVVS